MHEGGTSTIDAQCPTRSHTKRRREQHDGDVGRVDQRRDVDHQGAEGECQTQDQEVSRSGGVGYLVEQHDRHADEADPGATADQEAADAYYGPTESEKVLVGKDFVETAATTEARSKLSNKASC